jgi:hypothetical protein
MTNETVSKVASDPNASRAEKMIDRACDAIIVSNYLRDPTYTPYCGRCPGLHRMQLVEPFLWEHPCCGAVHDERQVLHDFPPTQAAVIRDNGDAP